MFKIKFPFFNEGEIGSGVEDTQVAAEQVEVPAIESGVDTEVAAEPDKQNNFEKAFAKRLAAKEAEWQAEREKYKDYETHKQISDYFQQINGADALSLKEQIELAKLQDRAEQANVPVEVLKRIDELEQKAAKADELEQKQQQEQTTNSYFSTLDRFVADKGVTKEALNQFMIDNDIPYNPNNMEKSFAVALRAMKAEQYETEKQQFETQKEQFEKDAVKKYLESKKAPKAEGTGSAGMQGQGVAKSWKEASQRALARIQSASKQV